MLIVGLRDHEAGFVTGHNTSILYSMFGIEMFVELFEQ